MSDFGNQDFFEGHMPGHLRGRPVEEQVAVLFERVGNGNERIAAMGREIQGLRRALWSFVFSIAGGALLFLFSVASGWIGPT